MDYRQVFQSAPVILSQDSTEPKQAVADLVKSHGQLTTILDGIDSLVYVADFDSHEILFINKYGRDVFDDVQGQLCWQALQKGQTGPCSFCTNNRLLTDAGAPAEVHRWEFQNTATGRTFECHDQAITWPGRGLVRMEMATDITERTEAVKLITQLREDKIIALQEKAEALSAREQLAIEMMANLSHDLRTPLAAIKGYSEALLAGGLEDAENRLDFVQTIMKHTDRLSFLIEDMLLLTDLDSRTKNPSFEFQSVDLASIVENYAKTLPLGTGAKNIPLAIDVAPGLMVRADADHLTRVLQNLIDNAIKYNRRGGRISIEARADGTVAAVTVRDTGRGIPKADLGLIFGRLYRGRVTKHLKGTGLGLAIVKSIIELHGGRIWVESVFRKGSAFHFTLPLAN